jgi:hypothetical protein
MNTQQCLSEADFVRLWEDDLTPQERQVFQQHLEDCCQCKTRWEEMSAGARHLETLFANREARQLEEDFAREGESWWSQYVAQQVLGLLAQAPDQIADFLESLGIKTTAFVRSDAVIELPVLQWTEGKTKRLAAGTGEGFAEQTIHQDQPPFEFHLVQFGEQLRIDIRTLDEDPPCKNCLARLELLTGGADLLLSRIVLVDEGQARLTLEPSDIHLLQLRQGDISIRLAPLVTRQQLTAAGIQAYLPILTRLLQHEDPTLRSNTAKVIARILGPQARPLVEPLANDGNEAVRLTVQRILRQFPGQPDAPEPHADV